MATSDRPGVGRWFTSTKHLVGVGAALIGPVLALTGVVSAPIGLAVTVPLYCAGALALSGRRTPGEVTLGGLDTSDVLGPLDDLERRIAGKVPPQVAATVQHIASTIRDTIPRASDLPAGAPQVNDVVKTATDYLPSALEAYMKLPRSYADTQPIQGDRTALDVLENQLGLLSAKMGDVFDAVCRSDADALVAHERFLHDKFAPGSLDLGPSRRESA